MTFPDPPPPQDGPQQGPPPHGPQHGAPQYGQPQYGQPQYGQPQYGQPQYGAPRYGTGQPGWGAPASGPGYGNVPPPVVSLRPGVVPLRPLGLGDLYDGAFRAIRHNPRIMLGITAVFAAVGSVGQELLTRATAGAESTFESSLELGDPTDPFSSTSTLVGIVVLAGVVVLVSAVAQVLSDGIVMASVGRSVLGKVAPFREVWAAVRGKRLGGLVVIALHGGVVMTVGVGVGVGVVALVARVAPLGVTVAVGVLLGLGLVVAVVWFAVRIVLAAPAYVLERGTVRQAVRRGWRLSQGSFWRLIGIGLLTSFAGSVLNGILGVPAALLQAFSDASGSATVRVLSEVVSVVLRTAGGTLVLAFTASVVALLYIDLRIRREGLDAALAAAAADAAAGRTTPVPGTTGLL